MRRVLRPKRPVWTLRGWPQVVMVGLCGCTGQTAAPAPPLYSTRPLLTPAVSEPAAAAPEQHTIPFPNQVSEWVSGKGRGCTLEERDGLASLAVAGAPGDLLLDIPGVYDVAAFNLVRLKGKFHGAYRVTIQLEGEGVELHRPPAMITLNQSGAQTLNFGIEKLLGEPVSFDALLVHVTGPAEPFEISALQLVQRPLHQFLARPGKQPGPVEIQATARPSIGLAVGVPVECHFEPELDATLEFAFGLPPHLMPRGGEPEVVVTLTSAEREAEQHTYTLDPDHSSWHVVQLPMASWAGHQVQARFEYRCTSGQPGVIALAGVEVWRPVEDPGTVLLISSDTHRADHVGVAGLGVEIDTPALDALAEGGLLFEDCWATTNVTSPSHVAIMTGIHPRDTRLINNFDRLTLEARTLAEAYREAGWKTWAIVSVGHLGPRGTDLGQGFDRILSPPRDPWRAEVATDALMQWLTEAGGRPVFVFLHVFDAHFPYDPPEEFDRHYYPAGRDPLDPSLPPLEVSKGCMPRELVKLGLRDVEFPRAQYKAEVSYLDQQLGRLMEHERLEQTLIAFTADHGEILEKSGSYFNHGELYPDTLHVPLILGGAALPAEFHGRRIARPVQLLDLGRTLLDLSNLPAVEFPGRNLLLASDRANAPARFAISAHGLSASIQRGRWFLLLHMKAHKGTLAERRRMHQIELFDLDADPQCLEDVRRVHPRRAQELRQRLVEWLAAAAPGGLSRRRHASAAEAAQLNALGYASDAGGVEESTWYDPKAR